MFLFSKTKENEENSNNEYNFLYDEPLSFCDKESKKEEIDFGHQYIADGLVRVLNSVKPPFTVGLFGRFGIGKSTIINNIKEKIEKDKNIKFVVFDAWKYERDSLRRQFLINLDVELNLGLNYKNNLYQSISETSKINNKFIFNFFIFTLIGLFFLSSIIIFIAYISYTVPLKINILKEVPIEFFSTIFGFSILSIFFTGLFNLFPQMFFTKQTSKIDSAEGFENKFYNEVLCSKKIRKIDKVCIVVDNLDRVSYKNAIGLLSDIKTFLSHGREKKNKAIFLIACDEAAIKKHLERCNYDEPEEFIRKFFNASFSIPPNLYLELDVYVKKQLEKTGLDLFKNNDNLKWILTRNFRSTPREIKQFINTLLIYYIISKEMEDQGQVVEKITSNLPGLAKLLLIKQKFPIIYKKLEERVLVDSVSWSEFYIESKKIYELLEKDKNNSSEKVKLICIEREHFLKFCEKESAINIKHLQAFIRLKQSSEELSVPEIGNIKIAIQGNDGERFEEIIKKINSDFSMSVDLLSNVDLLITSYNEQASSKKDFGILLNTIRVIGRLPLEIRKKFKNSLEYAVKFISFDFFYNKIKEFPPEDFLNMIYEVVDISTFKRVIHKYYLFLVNMKKEELNGISYEDREDIILQIIKTLKGKKFVGYSSHFNLLLETFLLEGIKKRDSKVIQVANSIGFKIDVVGFEPIDIEENFKVNNKSRVVFEVNLFDIKQKFTIYFYVETSRGRNYWVGYRNGEPGLYNATDENTVVVDLKNKTHFVLDETIKNILKRLPSDIEDIVLIKKVRLRADDQTKEPVSFNYRIK